MIESVGIASSPTHVLESHGIFEKQGSSHHAVMQQNNRGTQESEYTTYPSSDEVKQAVDNVNKTLMTVTHLRFRFHEDTHRYYVEIVDTLEDTVIREVPPKKFLDIVADMNKFMGVMVDEKR